MKPIAVKPNDLLKGLKQMVRETKNQMDSYLWLGTATTLPIQKLTDNPGLLVVRALQAKIREYRR